jgi:excisionase family DNA binding protein
MTIHSFAWGDGVGLRTIRTRRVSVYLAPTLPPHQDEPPMPAQKERAMAQTDDPDAPDALLTPSEVAQLFRVNPKTVTRWARAGKLTAIRTLGGHRRFRASEIRRCLEDLSSEEAPGTNSTRG